MRYRVTPLLESTFRLDGGAMFGIIPRPLWETTNPPDERNRIRMAARCLLVEGEGRRMLVDVGMGCAWNERERDIYHCIHPHGSLAGALAAAGLQPTDITDVVLTHLHFDHAGGLLTSGPDEPPAPLFPHAMHWVQRENWVWAHHPTPRDAGSYRRATFALLGTMDAPHLTLLDGRQTIAPGLVVHPLQGHTPGMQWLQIDLDHDTTLAWVADLMPTRGHVQPSRVMGYDLFPLTALREKQDFLEQAYEHGWLVGLEHDPDVAFIRIGRQGDRWSATPATLPASPPASSITPSPSNPTTP
jgi:glyoxylase-like metal-dependent hydrolase (beta-lactamase superfamily II)